MKILNLKNPRFLADGRIMLDALFDDSPGGEYELHVVCPHDAPTAERHAAALRGDFGPVAPYVPPSLDEYKAQKRAMLADYRYERETAGIVIGGTTIRTDRESQAQLSSAYTSMKASLIQSTEWKGADGWMTVTLTEIEPIAQAVAAHVADCFAVERLHAQAINGLSSIEAVQQYNFTSSWPA